MTDLIIFVLLGVIQIVTAVWGGIVSAKSLPAGENKKTHIAGFVFLGIIGFLLIVWTGVRNFDAQKDASKTQQQLQSKLDVAGEKLEQSLLNQQYSKGQLDSLSVMVGKLGQGNPDIASALKELARENSQKIADMNASKADLCKRAHSLAAKMRQFQTAFEAQLRDDQTANWTKEVSAATDADRRNIFAQSTQKLILDEFNHETNFREVYFVDAKYIRDLLMERLPKPARDMLVANNLQADGNLQRGTMNGAFNEVLIANYLDELGKSLCQDNAH